MRVIRVKGGQGGRTGQGLGGQDETDETEKKMKINLQADRSLQSIITDLQKCFK